MPLTSRRSLLTLAAASTTLLAAMPRFRFRPAKEMPA
jgi:hypothetical protein